MDHLSIAAPDDEDMMPRKIQFERQYKPIGFGDRLDLGTVEGNVNLGTSGSSTAPIRG
jgi:hypothetical protein